MATPARAALTRPEVLPDNAGDAGKETAAMCHPKPRAPWVICTLCRGDGSHVNPNVDAHGLTADELADDPDFARDYMAGVYDVPCVRCGGSGKIRADELERLEAAEAERAADRRTEARESGDVEGYLSASDPRWG